MGSVSTLPTTGARTGEMTETISRMLMARAASAPCARSAMIARPMTMPEAPEKPWTKRASTRMAMLGAVAAAMLATR